MFFLDDEFARDPTHHHRISQLFCFFGAVIGSLPCRPAAVVRRARDRSVLLMPALCWPSPVIEQVKNNPEKLNCKLLSAAAASAAGVQHSSQEAEL